MVDIRSVGSKEAYSVELKEYMYLSKVNHLFLKLQYLAHGFTVNTE
jgi:hypothetical protein